MDPWLPWVIGGAVIVVISVLVLLPRLWGGDDPPG